MRNLIFNCSINYQLTARVLKSASMKALLILAFAFSFNAYAEPNLDAYKGKFVYVDFWASWCTPCLASFPWLNQVHEKYKTQNFVVVGVNVDKKKELAENFLAEHPAKFPVVYDPSGSLAKKYKVEGMPYSIVLDPNGNVVHRHTGFESDQTAAYNKAIEAVLKN